MIGARLLLSLAIAAAPALARADGASTSYAGGVPPDAAQTEPTGAAPDAGAADAATTPAPIHRVVLLASTPELAHAARTALAPWAIEIVEDNRAMPVPMDDVVAGAIARERTADRVAWIAGGELVVFDPATGTTDRRPAPEGANDAPAAASVALSLKTSLRLPVVAAADPVPVEPEPGPVIDGPVVVEPGPARRIAIVPEVGGGVRVPVGGTLDPQPRLVVALGIVHRSHARWRPSVFVGFGPGVEAGKSGLKATWTDLEVGIQLAIELPFGSAWALVPRVQVAAHRTRLTGKLPMQEELAEGEIGGAVGLDLGVWWRAGRLRAGAGVGAAAWFGLADYERGNTMVFDSPSGSGQVFGTVLVDL